MKTTKLVPILLTAILFIACINDQFSETENNLPTLQKNWNQTELTTAFYNNQSMLSHHHIDAEKLRSICLQKDVVKFRFTLGLNLNQELAIDIAGISQKGRIVSSFSSVLNTENALENSINELQYSRYSYNEPSNATTHLLPYKTAYTYINTWENAVQKKQIENLITYEGERLRYYSLPKQIVEDMISSKNVGAIALFLGINTNNKLTPVFIQKAYNGSLLLKKANSYLGKTNNEGDPDPNEGNIYDFTESCPDMCDEE